VIDRGRAMASMPATLRTLGTTHPDRDVRLNVTRLTFE
jgi:hypothetical protein